MYWTRTKSGPSSTTFAAAVDLSASTPRPIPSTTGAWYGDLVGAYFDSHPAIQQGQIQVADRVHPSTEHLSARWQRRDEWYNYRRNPRGRVHILATLDEGSYDGGNHGFDHPIAWCHDYDGGRSWYTGGGHTRESYGEPQFMQHILGGIEYATGVTAADCGATLDTNFAKVVLDDAVENPIDLAVAPDGRVFFIERKGELNVYRPDLGLTRLAGQLAVSTDFEDGLLGIAIDPDFVRNNWLYLFYSPHGEEAKQHVSRFELDGDETAVGFRSCVAGNSHSAAYLLSFGWSAGIWPGWEPVYRRWR